MDADVGAVVAEAAEGDHLRAEALDDALGCVPGEDGLAGLEVEVGIDGGGEGTAAGVLEGAGGDGEGCRGCRRRIWR